MLDDPPENFLKMHDSEDKSCWTDSLHVIFWRELYDEGDVGKYYESLEEEAIFLFLVSTISIMC